MSTFLVVGDFMRDRYFCAYVRGKSAERSDLDVYTVESVFERPGGAANVAENLVALGEHTLCLAREPYPIKNRIIVRDEQVCRFDQDDVCQPVDVGAVGGWASAPEVKGVLVADYGKGAITPDIRNTLIASRKPLFVDTKGDPSEWMKASYAWLFPNSNEFAQFEESYRGASQVVWKRGSAGIARLHYGIEQESYPPFTPPSEVIDVCGAGDTVIAAFASHLLSNEPITPLAFANAAASIVVRKPFTATATKQEILGLFNDPVVQSLYC